MKLNRIICGALLALMVTAAEAEDVDVSDYSANYVLPGCKALLHERTGGFASGRCVGLVEGVAMLITMSKAFRPVFLREFPNFCADIPEHGVTTEQMIRVVVAYIEARPQRMHEVFYFLAIEALRDAWPCR